jgi:hypothetical protein
MIFLEIDAADRQTIGGALLEVLKEDWNRIAGHIAYPDDAEEG